MANKKAKFSRNSPGSFYVDDQCIACDACIIEAPRFFSMDDENVHAYVNKQPQSPSEIEECKNAMEACPVEAIGEDGSN